MLANEDLGCRLIVNREYEQGELKYLERLVREDDFCVNGSGRS